MGEIEGTVTSILTLGKRHTGFCLLTGMVLRILFISCGRKVRAASETQTDGRAPRSRHGTKHRGSGCGSFNMQSSLGAPVPAD